MQVPWIHGYQIEKGTMVRWEGGRLGEGAIVEVAFTPGTPDTTEDRTGPQQRTPVQINLPGEGAFCIRRHAASYS
jgi:hypothetical protein